MYLKNFGTLCSLVLGPAYCLSNFLVSLLFATIAALALLLNSHNSISCMNFATLHRSSSRSSINFLYRLSANGPDLSAVIMWCNATLRLKLWMFKATFMNLSINVCSDSSLSCRMFTSTMEFMWWGQHVANWVSNLVISVAKESINKEGSQVNQLSTSPFSEVGKTRHITTSIIVYNLICIVYKLICVVYHRHARRGPSSHHIYLWLTPSSLSVFELP